MSVNQVKDFVTGLKDITDSFKEDSEAILNTYKDEVAESKAKFEEIYPQLKDSAEQFQTASHAFAQDMIERADQYVAECDQLYNDIYGSNKA